MTKQSKPANPKAVFKMKLKNVIKVISFACIELVLVSCLQYLIMSNRLNTIKLLFKKEDKHA